MFRKMYAENKHPFCIQKTKTVSLSADGCLAFPARFERAAFRLGGERSIRLSYGNR